MKPLFQAGGHLSPHSAAYERSIYPRSYALFGPVQDALQFRPQIIGSPLLSGKTTQLHAIIGYHEKFVGPDRVRRLICDIPAEGWGEEKLRDQLAEELKANPDGSLRDILSSSQILGQMRCVVAFTNSERISNRALRWLLSGLKALNEDENESFRFSRKIQLLIDGNFSVETLTSGPNSPYPLPQIYPPEFSEIEQQNFLLTRLRHFKMQLTRKAINFLWQWTAGDKYLTQIVGEHFTKCEKRKSRSSIIWLGVRDVRAALENYSAWNLLYGPAINAIGELVLELSLRFESSNDLVQQLPRRWPYLPPELKSVAYNAGLIRRESIGKVSLRAPILTANLQSALVRANNCLGLIHSSFSLSGIDDEETSRATSALIEILSAAARQELMTIHVGHGKITHHGAQISAMILEGGSYEATWLIPDHRHPLDTPVWGLLWTVISDGNRRTEQRLFKIRCPQNGQLRTNVDKSKNS